MTFLLLSLGIALLPGRPRRRTRARLDVSLPLPLLASGCACVLAMALGGRVGLVLAGPLAVGAYRLTNRIIRSKRQEVDRGATALLLDLISAALATGLSVDGAIGAVDLAVSRYGDASLGQSVVPFRLVGRLLMLGSDPAQAWGELDLVDGLRPVAAAGRRCANSGARLASAFIETATELRAQHRQHQLGRAQRTGVWALLPLGLCFLPAFVCLGVVPVVLGVAGQVFGDGFGGGSTLQ